MAKKFGALRSNDDAVFDNFTATTNPTVNDCAPVYDVGSRWVNTTTQEVYFCVVDTEGAAIWEKITNQGGVFSGTLDDISAGSTNVHLTTTLKSGYDNHVASAHAPSNAQKNSDILKAEIEAKLTGEISSHTHAGGGSSTGVLEDVQISILQSDGTLNAASGVQTWCGTNKTAQDIFTVLANSTYRVRGQYYINTGATTHTTAIAWALSGSTVTFFEYQVLLWSAAANAIATAQSTVHVSGATSKVCNATSTAVYTIINFEGIIVIANGGTITPQINFSANPTGTNLMKRGSWVSFSLMGANTFVESGGWS